MESDRFKMEPADRVKNGKKPDRAKVVPKCLALVCFLLSLAKLENARRQASVMNCKFKKPGARRISEPLLWARHCLMCRVVRKRDTVQPLRAQV